MTGMFGFPDMLKNHIENSNLKQPEDFNNYNLEEFPHFSVFMATHLCCPVDVYALEDDANIIAAIPEDQIRAVTYGDLVEMGMSVASGNLV